MDADRLLEALGEQRAPAARRSAATRCASWRRARRCRPRFLVQVEAGAGNISVRKLLALARALGTTPAALLAGSGAARPNCR